MAKVLHIEDEIPFRQSVAMLLEKQGFEAIGTSDGEEGIRTILEHTPDIVLCDVNLPGLSGFDILREIRGSEQGVASVPFIFLSGRDIKHDILQGYKLDADDYLTKPIDFDVLLCKIQHYLHVRNRQAHDTRLSLEQGFERYNTLMTKVKSDILHMLQISRGSIHNPEKGYGKITDAGMELLAHINAEEAHILEDRAEKIPLVPVAEETLDMLEMLVSLCAYLKPHAEKRDILLHPEDSAFLPSVILADQKYFSKALESLFRQLILLSPSKSTLSLTLSTISDGSLLLSITNKNLDIDACKLLAYDSFIMEVLRFHGVEMSIRTLIGVPTVILHIPRYRVLQVY